MVRKKLSLFKFREEYHSEKEILEKRYSNLENIIGRCLPNVHKGYNQGRDECLLYEFYHTEDIEIKERILDFANDVSKLDGAELSVMPKGSPILISFDGNVTKPMKVLLAKSVDEEPDEIFEV